MRANSNDQLVCPSIGLRVAFPCALTLIFLLLGSHLKAVCVIVDKTPLRIKPQENAIIVEHSPYLTPLKYITKMGKWSEVEDSQGYRYWAKDTNLSHSLSCGKVKARQSRIRSGPGLSFQRISSVRLHRGQMLKVLQSRHNWKQVETKKGQIGWLQTRKLYKF